MTQQALTAAIAPLLNEANAAEILGVSRRTLADWRRRGGGPPFTRVGPRLVRYARTDLEGFMAAGRRVAPGSLRGRGPDHG